MFPQILSGAGSSDPPKTPRLNPPKADTYSRHDTYYFEDGNIILLAETTLFKLHKSLLVFSPFFRDLLSLRQPQGDAPQGGSDSNPIDISAKDVPTNLNVPSIKADEFSDFLSVFLPMTKTDMNRSSESWARILKIASMFQFDAIRALAISNLGPSADPIVKIDLGVRHDHRQFIVEGIRAMSLAPAPLPVEAALGLDAISFYQLVSAREAIRTHLAHKVTSGLTWTCNHGVRNGNYNSYSNPCNATSHVASELQTLITMPLPVKPPAGVDYKKPVQALAKESLMKHQLCDYCQAVWDTQITRLLDLERVDKIIEEQLDHSTGRAEAKILPGDKKGKAKGRSTS